MSSFFAAAFGDIDAARKAQLFVEKSADDGLIRLVASVVIGKGADGRITQHNGKTPGALGAGMGAVIGGIVGVLGGPAVAVVGAAGGALSGGWFDLLRTQDRDEFMNEVAREIDANHAALLGEVVNPSEDAKRVVEETLVKLGGVLIGKGP